MSFSLSRVLRVKESSEIIIAACKRFVLQSRINFCVKYTNYYNSYILFRENGYRGREIPFDAHRVLFTLDLDCPKIDDFIFEADREYMFAAPFKWLLIQRSNDTDDLITRFAEVGAYPDSEVTVWQKETGKLLSIYRTNGNSSHLIEDRGSWKEEDRRMVVGDTNVASKRRRNLGGIELKSCLVVQMVFRIGKLSGEHETFVFVRDRIVNFNE